MPGYRHTTVAVVGASGFIGRCVARKLSEQGARVCSIGRADAENLEAVFRRLRPSITFNLAGYGIDPLERDEAAAYRVNAELPQAICRAVAAWKDAGWAGLHLVHAGSGAEYGDAGGDLREDGPARPATLYAKSKWCGTQAVREVSQALGLRTLTARLFTVYGPGERRGRLLPSLIEAKKTGRPVDLSSGTQHRDFTYVGDAAEGLLRLGLTPERGCGIVNVATGILTTVRTFVETAAQIMGIPPENLLFGAIPPNPHEIRHDSIALERLKSLAAWIPGTTISDGIRKTVESGLLKGRES